MRGLVIMAAALSLLSGCATSPEVAALEDDATCAGWGAAAGSPDYAACRAALTAKRSADTARANQRFFAAMGAMQAVGGNASAPARSPVSFDAPPIRTTCFSKGERVSGMNKLCVYDCLGSAHVVTQSAVSLCPLTVQQ